MTNYEEVYYRFMPAFRAHVARLMVNEMGMTQEKAASLLGTTQAAVNGYINNQTSKSAKELQANMDQGEIGRFIKKINEGNESAAQRSVCKICQTRKSFNCAIMVK